MTTRIYYDDSRVTTFDAEVTSCVPADGGRFEVTVSRTALYPTSGGQPFDTGSLGDARVVDVIDRDGDVVHLVTAALAVGARIIGTVDGDRRRDHREQHTGQHVLSAAFDRTCAVATVGFHMGTDVSTIDLAREVTTREVEAAEAQANLVVRDNRAVRVRTVAAEQVAALGLRRESTRAGALRIIDVEDCDVSACGGTHVERTGEIGLIMVLASEKVRGGTRLSFVCGGRAVSQARARAAVLAEAGRLLGVPPLDVATHVVRLQEAAQAAARTITDLGAELATSRAADWRRAAETIGPYRVVIRDSGLDGAGLKTLAQALVAEPGVVAVLTGEGSPTPVVVARSADVAFDAGRVMKRATSELGGRGGGRPELAQGGLTAPGAAIDAFVRRVLEEYEAIEEERS